MPWFIAGALHLVLFAYAAPKLTTAKIEATRAGSLDSGDGTGADSIAGPSVGEIAVEDLATEMPSKMRMIGRAGAAPRR